MEPRSSRQEDLPAAGARNVPRGSRIARAIIAARAALRPAPIEIAQHGEGALLRALVGGDQALAVEAALERVLPSLAAEIVEQPGGDALDPGIAREGRDL